MNYVPGFGFKDCKLMLLTECPTYEDSVSGKLLSRARETYSLLSDAGINKNGIWITAVSKYHVPSNEGKKKVSFADRAKSVGIDIDQQLSDLQNEINIIKPNCILGLGRSTLWALTGRKAIDKLRGSILLGMGRKFVPTYNPEHLNYYASDIEFKGYWNKQIMIFDAKRALAQSAFEEIHRPIRQLQVARNSYDLQTFYDRFKHKTKVSVDIESLGICIPACIGLSFDGINGITAPLWNTEGISTIPDSDMITIWQLLAHILTQHEIIGQNFNYDRDKLKRLGFVIKKLADDTMMKAFALNPELPVNLAFNTSLYTEEPFYKDEGMYEGSIEDLFLGCARDACVTYEMNSNMDPDLDEIGQRAFYENFLMKLPDLYWEIENTGFGLDPIKREQLIRKYITWDEQTRYELFKLTGEEVNVNSPKQIQELLFTTLKCPKRDGTGEEELTALLNLASFTDPIKREVVEKILLGRRIRKSISTYLMAMPDYDGRLRTTCFPCLNTGRSSTGQQSPPIRPTVEVIDEHGKKKHRELGIAFQTITKHGDVGEDIRGMMVP